MGFSREIRARARYVVGPVLGVCAIGYFGYHATHGDRGLFALRQLQQRVVAAETALVDVRAERQALERRVRLLHPDSLDPDMLDERARLMLNVGHVEELVILDPRRRNAR